jgi:NADP-dependent 3-hydroxy acid dehydrogenase YdfG
MSSQIAGKIAVITGASSGLGEATARLLSAEGAIVVLGARRADHIEKPAQEIISRGGNPNRNFTKRQTLSLVPAT